MGTFSKVFIQEKDLTIVESQIQLFFKIGSKIVLDQEQIWFFHAKNGNDTIVLYQCNFNWITITFDFITGLYGYDEILRRMSKNLNCIILLGYYQSTSSDGRFAKFENGQLDLSISQISTDSEIILTDNFGVTAEIRKKFMIPSVGERYHGLDWDEIYKLYNFYSLSKFNDIPEDRYLHLENIVK